MIDHLSGNHREFFDPDKAYKAICDTTTMEARVTDTLRLPVVNHGFLRHTFATLALIGGVSPHAVTAALGHHDVAFTLRTYAHLLPGMHSEAMNAIGNLIFGPPATENVTRSVT